ncbi:MAG: 50S ribosomal protein L23 [Chloroflexota bacterium]
MHIYEVLKRPILTEKTMIMSDNDNKYTFEVDMRANKLLVAQAIEETFGVAVQGVRLMIMPAKTRRTRRGVGIRKSKWKKAIVDVAPGDTIQLFEGV